MDYNFIKYPLKKKSFGNDNENYIVKSYPPKYVDTIDTTDYGKHIKRTSMGLNMCIKEENFCNPGEIYIKPFSGSGNGYCTPCDDIYESQQSGKLSGTCIRKLKVLDYNQKETRQS